MAPKIRIEPSPIAITVEVRQGRHPPDEGVIRIVDGREEDVDCSVFLEVGDLKLRYDVDSRPVSLYDLTILFVPKTRRIFLGGQRLSSVVDLERGRVEHPFEHCLFWGFDSATRPGVILETGELDCLFRGLDGTVLAQVPVDPPWESVVEPGGIRFQSSVHGSQFLAFPKETR